MFPITPSHIVERFRGAHKSLAKQPFPQEASHIANYASELRKRGTKIAQKMQTSFLHDAYDHDNEQRMQHRIGKMLAIDAVLGGEYYHHLLSEYAIALERSSVATTMQEIPKHDRQLMSHPDEQHSFDRAIDLILHYVNADTRKREYNYSRFRDGLNYLKSVTYMEPHPGVRYACEFDDDFIAQLHEQGAPLEYFDVAYAQAWYAIFLDLREAAKTGHLAALGTLGMHLLKPSWVSDAFANAVKMLSTAAKQGDVKSLYVLARLYLQSSAHAARGGEYLEACIQRKYPPAMMHRAYQLIIEEPHAGSFSQGIELLQTAAAGGSHTAALILQCYSREAAEKITGNPRRMRTGRLRTD